MILTLLLLSILPLVYKFSFWLYAIQLKEYRFDRFKEYILTPQWKKAIFNFWFFIELTLFLFSFIIFIISDFKVLIYNSLFYFLLIQNFFVIQKIFKNKLIKPKLTSRLLVTLLFILTWTSFIIFFIFLNSNINENVLLLFYIYLIFNFLITPFIIFLYIILTLPLVNYLKNKKISIASDKSKKNNNIIKIWITWSYWKTSVKEYLTQILSKENKTLSTPKNINTELWVSDIIINKLNNDYKYFVAEMWAYRIWEIKTLWNIVNHKYGFLTAIWNQHLWLFWWIKNIIKAKSEIAEKILKNNGVLYINYDNENIRKIKFDKKLNIIKYWTNKNCDAIALINENKNWITKFELKYKWKTTTFQTSIIWKHNIINLSWVLAFCIDMWIHQNNLKKYLSELKSLEKILEITKTKNYIKINDTCNLSEDWLFAWLNVLNSTWKNKNNVLIIDDILELGADSEKIHFEFWKKISEKKLINQIMYVWVNYRKYFIKWLVFGWFDSKNIINNYKEIKKDSVILFEWRKAWDYLDKF